MAKKNLAGSYDKSQHRWVKMIEGERFFLLCRPRKPNEEVTPNKWHLGLPKDQWTKDKSQDAANEFWEQRPDKQELIQKITKFTQTMMMSGIQPQTPLARQLWEQIDTVEEPIPAIVDAVMSTKTPVDDARSLVTLADTFLKSRHEEVPVKLSAGGYDNLRRNLKHWKTFATGKSLDDVGYDLLKSWHLTCLKMTLAQSSVSEIYAAGKQFIKWLWKSERIASLPRNWDDYTIEIDLREEHPTYTVEEVKQLITEAPGQLKLHLLCMANFGWTQIDIATLEKSMVNLAAGTITRKRAKTGRKKKVPKVTYKIWPATLELLKKYESNDPVLFLTTESGLPWVRRSLKDVEVDGDTETRMTRTDAIVSNFRHIRKRLKISGEGKSLNVFRKTSGNLLEQHERFAPVSTLFLGHAPKTIKEKNYVQPKQSLLDAAIDWLATQYDI